MKTKKQPSLPGRLVTVALAEVGVKEVGSTNCGPRVNEYKAATTLPPKEAWAWCAAFVCWCVKRAMGTEKFTFTRPTTAGAFAFENWSKAQDASTHTRLNPDTDIKAGDIVIFRFSHIGIAIADADKDTGTIATVEGNTDGGGSRDGGGVYRKIRRLSQVRSRIRFTV